MHVKARSRLSLVNSLAGLTRQHILCSSQADHLCRLDSECSRRIVVVLWPLGRWRGLATLFIDPERESQGFFFSSELLKLNSAGDLV